MRVVLNRFYFSGHGFHPSSNFSYYGYGRRASDSLLSQLALGQKGKTLPTCGKTHRNTCYAEQIETCPKKVCFLGCWTCIWRYYAPSIRKPILRRTVLPSTTFDGKRLFLLPCPPLRPPFRFLLPPFPRLPFPPIPAFFTLAPTFGRRKSNKCFQRAEIS